MCACACVLKPSMFAKKGSSIFFGVRSLFGTIFNLLDWWLKVNG